MPTSRSATRSSSTAGHSTRPDQVDDERVAEKRYASLDDGLWYFHVRARDAAGLWGPAAHRAVRIDTGWPTTTVDAPDGWLGHRRHPAARGDASTASRLGAPARVSPTASRPTSGTSTCRRRAGRSTTRSIRQSSRLRASTRLDYYSTDAAGNEEPPHKTCEVKIDLTDPTMTQEGAADSLVGAEWHADDVQVRFHGSDAGGSGWMTMDGSSDSGVTWKPDYDETWDVPAPPDGSNDGVHEYWYRGWDWAANLYDPDVCWVLIDTQPPTTTHNVAAGWHNSDVNIDLGATDAHSGILKTEYKLDDGYWRRGTNLTVPAPADGTNDGVHTLRFRSVDQALNIEETQSCEVKIDTQAPVVWDDNDGLWHRGYELHLLGDDGRSGLDRVEYSLNGGVWVVGDVVSLAVRKRGGYSGVNLVDYHGVDRAGNVSADVHAEVRIDSLPPVTSDDAPDLPQSADTLVMLTCDDPLSGWAATFYSVDGGPWQSGTQVLVPAPSDGSNNGLHWIAYYSQDAVGNNENWRFCPVLILAP